MAFCSHCGAPLKNGARFCENCGAPVEAAPQQNYQQQPNYQQPYQQPYPQGGYPQQPYPQGYPNPGYPYPPQPNPVRPPEKVSFIRSLLVTIALFASLAALAISLVMECINGSGINLIEGMKSCFNSINGAKGDALVFNIITTIVMVLPAIGIAIFVPIALATGIKAIIKKGLPSYGVCGAAFGFALPYFYAYLCPLLATNDQQGFVFPDLSKSTAFLIYLVGVAIYLGFGLVNAYMSAIENKKNLGAPIVKTLTVAIGVASIVFLLTPIIAVMYKDSGGVVSYSSESPMTMYTAMAIMIGFSSGDSFTFEILLPLFTLLFMCFPMIFSFVALGDLFGKNTGNSKSSPFILLIVTIGVCIASVFVTYKRITPEIQMGLPSFAGFAALALSLVHMIFGIVSAKLDNKI